MKSEQIKLIKESWLKVLPISETAAELFYKKLFELDPELKFLFKGDMNEQGIKLMNMLNTVVNSLDKLSTIIPAVEILGVRHIDYGVKDENYDTVADALLWALGKGLGDDFTHDVKDAWTTAYVTLADVMKNAANDAVA